MPARIRVLEATWSSKSSNEVVESVRSLMPTEAMFNQWLVEHEDVGDHLYRKCKTLDISRSEAIVCTDESKPKYKAPDWPKFYPLLGPPPALSTESAQSYNNLITGFRQASRQRAPAARVLAGRSQPESLPALQSVHCRSTQR
jgi:hypothetical protein